MVYENGQWLRETADMQMEEEMFKKAVEALLPVIRMWKLADMPYEGQPHMILPHILHLLAGDILKQEALPKSRNLRLLMVPDVQEQKLKDKGV